MSSLVIKIANARIPSIFPSDNDGGTLSNTGHMWFTLTDNAGNSHDYGFHPLHEGAPGVWPFPTEIGKVHDNDSAYYTTVDSSENFTLNTEQFSKVAAWANATVNNGWGNYNGLNNSCIDFVWEAAR
jgi:hypothetical protein